MFQVIELKSLAAIEPFVSVWEELHERSPHPDFIRSYQWFEQVIRDANGRLTPNVLIVFVLNRPIGVMPLIVEKRKTAVGTLKVLSYLDADLFSRIGPVGPNSAATLAGAMKHLRHNKRHWDVLDLQAVDKAGEDHRRTPNAMKNAGLGFHERLWSSTAVVNHQRRVRPMIEVDSLVSSGYGYEHHRRLTPELERIICAHQESDTNAIPSWLEFASNMGQLDIHSLLKHGRPVAAAFGTRVNGVVQLNDFRSAYSVESLVLNSFLEKIFQKAFQSGISDCLVANPALVRGLKASDRFFTYRYTHFSSRSLRAKLLSVHQTGKRWVVNPAGPPQPGKRIGSGESVAASAMMERDSAEQASDMPTRESRPSAMPSNEASLKVYAGPPTDSA